MADRTPEDIADIEGRAEIESRAELEDRIDRLQAAADDAAGQVRNLYIALLSFGLYLAITVGATTDEQLLRENPVRLPIVDVGLPLIAFYWIAPLLFVLFHFNLLMQLYLLSEKLHQLDEAIRPLPDDVQRERRATFSQFVFSQMLIGGHRRPLIRTLLHVIGWTTFVVLPVAVLLLAQIQFLPHHDPFTTWWQRCLILLDLMLLWLLWLPAIELTGRLSRAQPFYWRAWPVFGLLSLSAVSLLIALLVATIPGEFLAGPIDRLIAERGDLDVLHRNLSLREKQLVLQLPEPGLIENIGEEEALAKYTRGLDLRGRDLRYADLQFADLRKADLRGADLRGADLLRADLRGADLLRADLRGAALWSADLQGANLRRADLRGANLPLADLQGANLWRADLQGADLGGADLRGANLEGAGLRGTNLSCNQFGRCTDLQGANLWRADLRGADLSWAYLQGANLDHADLQGAILEGANLKGADLGVAHLWRATIGDEPDRDALWDLADLRGADIEPVDVGALIVEVEANIADEPTRKEVLGHLELTLRDDDRPEVPSWQGQPHVIFQESDPIPRALGWTAPTMTEADYDERLATFLGNLACGDDGSPARAQGIARRALGEPNRLFSWRLAQRLTSGDPEACPATAELPEDLRSRLEQLAARPDPPPPDPAEADPAPLDPPSQERQPSLPNE